ncbi:hypothetical protein EDC04DRAFT_1128178 [Pisolithus marmoratus]|nr:hypothetical protein EDC04DRAFT_1128178 [Pisolithus marmoratus]
MGSLPSVQHHTSLVTFLVCTHILCVFATRFISRHGAISLQVGAIARGGTQARSARPVAQGALFENGMRRRYQWEPIGTNSGPLLNLSGTVV